MSRKPVMPSRKPDPSVEEYVPPPKPHVVSPHLAEEERRVDEEDRENFELGRDQDLESATCNERQDGHGHDPEGRERGEDARVTPIRFPCHGRLGRRSVAHGSG